MRNDYKGYSLFNDVENATLRTWNRCALAFNINSVGESGDYMDCIDEQGQKQMRAMFQYIKVEGYDNARKYVHGNLRPVGGVH